MKIDENAVRGLSRKLNEPKWLLNERLKAFYIFEKLNKNKFDTTFGKAPNFKILKKDGVQINSLHFLLNDKNRSGFARTIFMNRHFKPEESAEVAFADAFFTECNLLWVEKKGNARIESGGAAGALAINIFILEENATLECEFASANSSFSLSEFYIPENAKCRVVCFIGGNAVMRNAAMLFGGKSDINLVERFIGSGNDKISLNSSFFHISKNSRSNYESRGVLEQNASAAVGSLSRISKGASGSSSFLSEKILLLDKGAHATADPQLEIEENDVTASHSASVSEIGEEQLFYLMSRGFSEHDAKKLIVEGFVGQVK